MDQPDKKPRSFLGALRRTLLFGIGSVVIVQEKMVEFVEQAIERGQETQTEGKKLVQEMRTGRKRGRPERIDALDVRINHALKRLNIPTRGDIDKLDRHITALSERIDELKSAD